jgi:hypothetical protein
MNSLFCFGLGYTARALARSLPAENWTVAGTSRSAPVPPLWQRSAFQRLRLTAKPGSPAMPWTG